MLFYDRFNKKSFLPPYLCTFSFRKIFITRKEFTLDSAYRIEISLGKYFYDTISCGM